MPTAKGLLLVLMEPPSSGEDEFNDWYDTEHVPERAAVAGFETAIRYVCLDGWPRYMALYDLASLAVLESDAYRAIAGPNLSVWSKRVLGGIRGYHRVEGSQLLPGDATTRLDPGRTHLTLLRFRGGDEPALQDALQNRLGSDPGVTQLRLYRNEASPEEHVVLIEHRTPMHTFPIPAELTGARLGSLDLANSYAPYWRR